MAIAAVQVQEPHSDGVNCLSQSEVVHQDNTTTKLRIVYDASAKSDGPSLNDCLHKFHATYPKQLATIPII